MWFVLSNVQAHLLFAGLQDTVVTQLTDELGGTNGLCGLSRLLEAKGNSMSLGHESH